MPSTLIYHDAVYGTVEITEPVLLDLLDSTAMQRLHGVFQHGISGWLGITGPVTRYEHSVGTMLLTRRLGVSLLAQIAALLHDVSHTAWSHVIDYVMEQADGRSYHEVQKAPYMTGSDIPTILADHGYDWHDVLYEDAFPVLEQPTPALCADRLDYFFRDSRGMNLATDADIHAILSHLVLYDSRIVTTDVGVARRLAETYMAMDQASWANFREVGLYNLMAQAIQTGLRQGILEKRDFWTTDEAVWAKLHSSNNAEFQQQLHLISKNTRFIRDETSPEFRVRVKLRTIDPDVLIDGQVHTLSSIDHIFARERERYLRKGQDPWPIRVIRME